MNEAGFQKRFVGSRHNCAQAEFTKVADDLVYKFGRTSAGAATAYICEDFVCRLPTTSAEELATLLRS